MVMVSVSVSVGKVGKEQLGIELWQLILMLFLELMLLLLLNVVLVEGRRCACLGLDAALLPQIFGEGVLRLVLLLVLLDALFDHGIGR